MTADPDLVIATAAVLARHALPRSGQPARASAAIALASRAASGARWSAPSRSRSRPTAGTGARPARARCWPRARGAMMPEIAPAEAGPGALILFRMTPRAIAKHVGILTAPDTLHPCL